MSFSQRLGLIQQRVAQAALRSGRDAGEITLIGVSKRKPLSDMQAAYDAGLRHFGENRAQEVRDKFPEFSPAGITRHFIGHLQSNKVKYLPNRVDMIHSVDSEKIARAINHRFAAEGLTIPVLVEVNVSGESAKEGVAPEEASHLAELCASFENLQFQGLMTIGPLTSDRERIRESFRRMKALTEDVADLVEGVEAPVLSMGMTGDFEIAIEEGATHVRVGTAIFGARE